MKSDENQTCTADVIIYLFKIATVIVNGDSKVFSMTKTFFLNQDFA